MAVKRLSAVFALVALLVPAALSAQRLPLPGTGRRGPARPAPLPPQVEPVARDLAYKRLPLSVESYQLISHVRSPTGDGVFQDWTSFGTGTRADYRVARNVAITLDLTSSFAGGPVDVYTMELGTRLRPDRSERRLYPFVDVRAGYVRSYNTTFNPFSGEFGFPTTEEGGFRYSSGFGGVIGGGAEYALTRRFSLTTAAALMRNHMTTRTLAGPDQGERSFTMTIYRYIIGIRYNPVRVIRPPMSGAR